MSGGQTANVFRRDQQKPFVEGSVEIGRLLKDEGVDSFGVSDVHEGIALRQAGIKKSILLPISNRFPLNLRPYMALCETRRRMASVSWISPPFPGFVLERHSKI